MPVEQFVDFIVATAALQVKADLAVNSLVYKSGSRFLLVKSQRATPALISNQDEVYLPSETNLNVLRTHQVFANKQLLNSISLNVKSNNYTLLSNQTFNSSDAFLISLSSFPNGPFTSNSKIDYNFSEARLNILSDEDNLELAWYTSTNMISPQEILLSDEGDGDGGEDPDQTSTLKEFWA